MFVFCNVSPTLHRNVPNSYQGSRKYRVKLLFDSEGEVQTFMEMENVDVRSVTGLSTAVNNKFGDIQNNNWKKLAVESFDSQLISDMRILFS